MDGAEVQCRTMFGNNWGFFLGTGDSLQRIDVPGRWEDLLFAFSRNDITASVREEMSYTLQFRGSGARVLRGRITGPRSTEPLVLEIRKWSPVRAQWSTYYRGTVDDTTIVVHADFTEASAKPVGVAQDLIDKADKEFTVTLTGKRIEIPRMWTVKPLSAVQSGSSGSTPMKDIPAGENGQISVSVTINPNREGSTPGLDILFKGSKFPQPYFYPSVFEDCLICARAGKYKITSNAHIYLELRGKDKGEDKAIVLMDTPDYYPNVPSNQTYVKAGDAWIVNGGSDTVSLAKGDTIKLCARTISNGNLSVTGMVSKKGTVITDVRMVQEFHSGSITIEPIQDIGAVPPISAPAVRDTELFAQVCRQATGKADLVFDLTRYRPAYFVNPDGSAAAVFLLSLSRLRESVVKDGASTVQGTDEAYFKGLTLRQFYGYFLAQGYKVAVEQRTGRDGETYPAVVLDSYCNSDRSSRYFPPDPATIVDLGEAVTDLELSRYEHTFTRVAAGSDPEDYGAYPREEGYQDPCNRRITYAIDGTEGGGGDPYTIEVPWPLTTLGLEEALRTYEGEDEAARERRRTEGEGIHLVCGRADGDGQIASITQYDPVPGQFYRPLNLGFRPESLVRRSVPLLRMALDPYTMDDTFFVPAEVEGDTVSVQAAGFGTGDAFLDTYVTDDPVWETYRDPDDPGAGPRGLLRPVMVTLRSTTDRNIYALLHGEATRYGVVRFRHRGREVAGYLRSVELNPTELSVQKWELLPVWGQDLSFING